LHQFRKKNSRNDPGAFYLHLHCVALALDGIHHSIHIFLSAFPGNGQPFENRLRVFLAIMISVTFKRVRIPSPAL
jgi:hypothetical protein